MLRYLFALSLIAAVVAAVCTSDADCIVGCETCEGECESVCTAGQECVQIDFGVGECTDLCDPAACETYDEQLEACVSTCGGCESCDAGQCATDEDLRNECGKCPGDDGFAECCVLDDNIAFTGCLVVGRNGTEINERLNDLECRIVALEQTAGCSDDADCTDCDTCTVDACEMGSCVHTPVATPDAGLRCGQCADFAPGPTGRCDDGNPCTIDYCVAGTCVHKVQLHCQ